MASVFLDTGRPAGMSVLTVHCGSPQTDQAFNFPGVDRVRVYDDGSLVGLDSDGASIVYMIPGTYWGYLWA